MKVKGRSTVGTEFLTLTTGLRPNRRARRPSRIYFAPMISFGMSPESVLRPYRSRNLSTFEASR